MLPGADAGQTLGQLGSTIVCSVFAGLLKGDPCSYLNVDPCWTPNDDPLLQSGIDNIDDESWSLASIIRLSGLGYCCMRGDKALVSSRSTRGTRISREWAMPVQS